eukprot:gnl/MRDRNA2_/MRDRNA2_105755_c0_seq1.p1 gnl/MRDRNA2_/MRDRNA2_105755_c0~~gnl/MRDRNA2_/MRDRNA2_105755_c0_seq1.p1  ORF type:complete len:478 (+),score=75.50 gnl/MRDRNA2_/MRDRNA2_105755_c0_seq1:84-1517(+)
MALGRRPKIPAITASPIKSISVLLTGGPGGGKSSALACLRDRLTKRGFQVLVVPETATPLFGNSGGYDSAWHGTKKHVELQKILTRYQLDQEKAFRGLAQLRDKPFVLLHDRGCLDGRLFCTETEWAETLEALDINEADLLKNYDLVIHMTTCASGSTNKFYEFGPGSSNPARYHNAEQAIETDCQAQQIYKAHPQVRVVANFPEFQDKLDTVVRYVTEAVECENVGSNVRERCLLPCEGGDNLQETSMCCAPWPAEVSRDIFDIDITFLDSSRTESIRRRCRVQKISEPQLKEVLPGDIPIEDSQALYEYRHERKVEGKTLTTRRVLGRDAYYLAKHRSESTSIDVRKRAICFIWEGYYYEIGSYTHGDGAPLQSDDLAFSSHCILEKSKDAPMPSWLNSPPKQKEGTDQTQVKRGLKRHGTIDAALVVAECSMHRSKVLRREVSKEHDNFQSRLDMLLHSPDVAKAAAVVAIGKM